MGRSVRIGIAKVLEQVGEAALPTAALLARALCEDAEGGVRETAAKAIGGLAPAALPVVHVALLWAAVRDEESDVRAEARKALEVLSTVAALRGEPRTIVAFAESLAEVAESLKTLGPSAVSQAASALALAAGGHGDDEAVRVAVAMALKALE